MRRRRLRLILIAALVAFLAQPSGLAVRRVPAAVAAGPAGSGETAAHVPVSAEPIVVTDALALDGLDRAVGEADLAVARHQATLDDASRARQAAEVDLNRLRTRLAEAAAAVDSLRSQLAEHAVSLYVSPQDDVMRNIAGSADIADSTRRRGLASTIAAAGPAALERLRAEQKDLLRLSAAVELALFRAAEGADKEAVVRRQLAEASTVRVELADVLAERIAERKDHIDGLEVGEAEIVRIITTAQLEAENEVRQAARREADRRLRRPASSDITSPFGWRWGRLHAGVDFDGDIGDTVTAARDGLVISADYNTGGYGLTIIIDHGSGLTTLYAHLSAVDVEVGDRVERGDSIGAIGASGNVTGSHLHFETREHGVAVDPAPYLG